MFGPFRPLLLFRLRRESSSRHGTNSDFASSSFFLFSDVTPSTSLGTKLLRARESCAELSLSLGRPPNSPVLFRRRRRARPTQATCEDRRSRLRPPSLARSSAGSSSYFFLPFFLLFGFDAARGNKGNQLVALGAHRFLPRQNGSRKVTIAH